MVARLEWLAGLMDAEGCFHLRRHSTRPNSVVVTVTVGLVHRPAMDVVRSLIAEVIGSEPSLDVRAPRKTERGSQREFYSVTVSGKDKVFALLTALCPLLRGKRVEARLALDVVGRARLDRHYRATDADFEIQRLSSEIKRGSPGAKERALGMVSSPLPPPSTPWLAGMLDGDGSVGIVQLVRGNRSYFQPSIVFGGADLEAVDDLRGVIGREFVTEVTTRPPRGGAREFFSFGILREHMRPFLARVEPILVVKKAEASVLLSHLDGRIEAERAFGFLRRLKTADYLSVAHDLEQTSA